MEVGVRRNATTRKALWLGPPSAAPPDLEERLEDRSRREPSAQERALIDAMESDLKKSDQFHVATNELEHFLLSPEDNAISVLSFVENACEEGGRKTFAVLESKRGIEVAEISRVFEALQEYQHRNHSKLQEAIENLDAKQSRLLATMERKQKKSSAEV